MNYRGLKYLRSGKGVQNPNTYWNRQPRPRCRSCGKKIRGPNHNQVRGCGK